MRLGMSRLSSRADAEDCASEAIVRTVTRDGVDDADIGRYLTTVMVNLCADVQRRHCREQRAITRLAVPGQHHPPADDICDQSEAEWLLAQVPALAPREARVLQAFAAGLTPGETARSLGMTPKAVESAAGRARRRLRALLRTTLVVGAVNFARRWLRPAVPSTTAVAAAAVAMTFTVGAAQLAQAGPRLETMPAQSRLAATAVTSHLAVRVASRAGMHRTRIGTTAPHADSSADVPSAQAPQVETHLAGPARGTGVSVTRRDSDRTFADSLVACLKGGPAVAPRYIGCPG